MKSKTEAPAGPTILVVDDDKSIRTALREYFEIAGYAVREAGSAEEARTSLALVDFDLVTLDLGLGSSNGLDLAREIRATSDTPIIMITARNDEIDRVVGLEIGADDYVAKPFALRELLARVRAVLRRTKRAPPTPIGAIREATTFANYILDDASKIVYNTTGTQVNLTAGEFALLQVFLARPGRLLSRNELLDFTSQGQASPYDRSIDTLVSRLRKKLEPASGSPALITTVRGMGYMFTAAVERAPVRSLRSSG